MDRRLERHLEILTAVGEGRPLTQRALAQRLGVALGLTNLYLKHLAKKGFLKIVEFPRKPAARKRLQYVLTSKGIVEKTRLTYENMVYSLNLYRRARQTLREALNLLPQNGFRRIALYGTGEAAELAYLTLKEFGIEPMGIFGREPGGHFLGLPVRDISELLKEAFDGVVLATFEPPDPRLAELEGLGLSREKFLLLRPPAGGETLLARKRPEGAALRRPTGDPGPPANPGTGPPRPDGPVQADCLREDRDIY